MIWSIGTDILNIERIDQIIKRYDQKFIDRIYGKKEIEISKRKLNNSKNFFGKRFAAKEATWKALGPLRGKGLFFKEIEILNDINGKPFLFFSGNTKKYIEAKEKKLKAQLKFDITLSDDPPFAIAFVVISLAPYV